MHNLGMEQDAVKPAGVVGDRRIRRGFARGHRAETGRQRIDTVAVAHPYLLASAFWPQTVEEPALGRDVDKGAAEFLVLAQRDLAAQLRAHRLHAVANAEHRHPEPKDDLGRARRGGFGQRGRPARQYDCTRRKIADALLGDRERMDLAVNAVLAHAAGDQLRDLAAEIEDQNLIHHRHWPWKKKEKRFNAKDAEDPQRARWPLNRIGAFVSSARPLRPLRRYVSFSPL